jgi:hypothetical protein
MYQRGNRIHANKEIGMLPRNPARKVDLFPVEVLDEVSHLLSSRAHAVWRRHSRPPWYTDTVGAILPPGANLPGQITYIGANSGYVAALFPAIKQDLHGIHGIRKIVIPDTTLCKRDCLPELIGCDVL